MTLRSTGSDVNKGFEPPLLDEAEFRGGGGVKATFGCPSGTTGDPLEGEDLPLYPLILAEADGDFLSFSISVAQEAEEFLFWIRLNCFFRRSLALSRWRFLSSFDQYLPI